SARSCFLKRPALSPTSVTKVSPMPRPPTATLSRSSARTAPAVATASASAASAILAAPIASFSSAAVRAGSRSPMQDRIEGEPGEQDQPGVAVRLEHHETLQRVLDVEPRDLPGEMGGESEEPEREDEAGARAPSGGGDQSNGEGIADREHRLGALAEEQRRRLDADQRVVLAILVRVDGVVADHPGDRA